jgi:hypothetical protein
MKALRLLALLLASAVDAAAGVISLEVPLSPTPSGVSGSVLTSPLANTFPLALSPNTPSLSPAFKPSIPPGAVPVAVALKPAALKPMAVPSVAALPAGLTKSALKPVLSSPAKAGAPAKVIDSLREHGALSSNLGKLDGENGKTALESNFMSAASLGDGTPVDGNSSKGDGSNLAPKTDSRPLLERVLEKVKLDDRGKADEKKALADAFKRMLDTPTGRRYAEEFLAEGLTAVVHFEDFPDSQLYLVDGKKKFYAAQAYTDWRQEGYAEVRLNRHYVDGDPEYLKNSLPSVIGHELLGHGLWYGRAAKENLYLAFHYHELNETHARVVGWSIDHELDDRIEEQGAWTYLQDPAYYLALLKMRLPYYAVTFSRQEMADAIGSMKTRLTAAQQELIRARQNLANQQSWQGVLDHFSSGHGLPASRFTMIRQEQADLVNHYTNEVTNAESIVREVGALIERMEAEPNRDSQVYLQQSSQSPFFGRLEQEIDRATKALRARVAARPPDSEQLVVPSARPKDQLTWDELRKLYEDDVAADASRPAGKKHWVH